MTYSTDLSLFTQCGGDTTTVGVGGDVDRQSSPRLLGHMLCAIDKHGPRLILDVSRVTFLDSAGVEAILTARFRSQLMGGWLLLVSVPSRVRRILEVLGLDAVLVGPVPACPNWL